MCYVISLAVLGFVRSKGTYFVTCPTILVYLGISCSVDSSHRMIDYIVINSLELFPDSIGTHLRRIGRTVY